jgi:competence protein ComEA
VVPTQDEFDRGQVVAAPSTGSTSGQQEGGGSAAGTRSEPTGPLDLNTASATELETLPGIGPVTAAKIVEDRERNGPFASVDELVRVSGIGEKKLEAVQDLVVVR